MDDEKKAILAERKILAQDCLNTAKEALVEGMIDAATHCIDMAQRQLAHWPTEF